MDQAVETLDADQIVRVVDSNQRFRPQPGLPRTRRLWRSVAKPIALLAALLMTQSPSLRASAADPPKSRLEHLQEREERDTANEAYWRGQHQKFLKRQATAELEVERTTANYTRARRLRRNRGGPSGTARQARDEAREELKAANTALDQFYEKARRAGAKPGWLRVKD